MTALCNKKSNNIRYYQKTKATKRGQFMYIITIRNPENSNVGMNYRNSLGI